MFMMRYGVNEMDREVLHKRTQKIKDICVYNKQEQHH